MIKIPLDTEEWISIWIRKSPKYFFQILIAAFIFLCISMLICFLFQIANMFDANSLAPLFDLFPDLRILGNVVKSSAIIAEFLDDLVMNVTSNGLTLDLTSLFAESPTFIKLMDSFLDAHPNTFEALGTIQIMPNRVSLLWRSLKIISYYMVI